MEDIEKTFLKECIKNNYSKKDIESFEKAIKFSKKYLGEKNRKNNDSFFLHALRTASYLIKGKLANEIIMAGLLYKIETKITEKNLSEKFGKEISKIVFGQLEIQKTRELSKSANDSTIRQILLTKIQDIRIILVKLAAKLDNLKQINSLDKTKQKKIAKEVISLYVPLATSLEIESIRKDLLDSAFKIINPKKYQEISNFLKESKEEREKTIEKIIKKFKKILNGKVKIIKIKGREKQIFSIYEKMTKKKRPLNKQKDHFAIRIITNSKEDCYKVLGELNKIYLPVEKTLKDYIKKPKENGYQSLHIIFNIEEKKQLEVQIRTKEMDYFAEEGNASHWAYKKTNTNKKFEKKLAWIKEVFKIKEQERNKEFLKGLKLNLFEYKIYCYTPKGKAIKLPKDATLLDFAYKIHAEIGNKSIGGTINNKFTALKTKLKDGDTVEIITNKFQRPRRDWMKFVMTNYAKKIIAREVQKYEKIPVTKKTSLKKQNKNEIEQLIVINEFPNHLISFAKCCNPIPREKIIGIVKSHKKILVHNANCKKIQKSQKSQIDANWKETIQKPIKLIVEAKDRSGILSDILNTITRKGFKVNEASGKFIGNNMAECFFIINLTTIDEVTEIINRIKKIENVSKIIIGEN